MLTLDLRAAIARAATMAGFGTAAVDPKLRPGGPPGTYASSIAFGLAVGARHPAAIAEALAGRLATEEWIARAEVTGDGFITLTVTMQALAGVAARITAAGPRCADSDVLRGVTVSRSPRADLESAATEEEAQAWLAAELTARLAEAAGATLSRDADKADRRTDGQVAAERDAAGNPDAGDHDAGDLDGGGAGRSRSAHGNGALTGVIAVAGRDAVRFALARVIPGRPLQALDPATVARNSLDNPAYAVRYAHARAASGVRWAAALQAATPAQGEAAEPCLPADPADLALLDALSWLPERVAIAARRGRPDEFARYLEELSRATIAASRFIGTAGDDRANRANDERLALARDLATAARTALAAGLGLLGVTAPDRL